MIQFLSVSSECSFFICCVMCTVFFFFKQKTAYEMRISDWSSDVCSSDLVRCSQGPGRSERRFVHHCHNRRFLFTPDRRSTGGAGGWIDCRLPGRRLPGSTTGTRRPQDRSSVG